jgi:hypothetical protein
MLLHLGSPPSSSHSPELAISASYHVNMSEIFAHVISDPGCPGELSEAVGVLGYFSKRIILTIRSRILSQDPAPYLPKLWRNVLVLNTHPNELCCAAPCV